MERWGILAHGTWSDLENTKWEAFGDLNFFFLSLKREQKRASSLASTTAGERGLREPFSCNHACGCGGFF